MALGFASSTPLALLSVRRLFVTLSQEYCVNGIAGFSVIPLNIEAARQRNQRRKLDNLLYLAN
jgi:hypothetical protein